MRVIVADDHEVVRKGVCTVLESHEKLGACHEACDGEEAVQKAMQLKPDLIILDITMPTMDGLSAAKQIRKILPEVPIIMLSVHEGPEIIRAAQQAGAQGFVTKNDVAAILLQAVDAVLEGQTFFSPGPASAGARGSNGSS